MKKNGWDKYSVGYLQGDSLFSYSNRGKFILVKQIILLSLQM